MAPLVDPPAARSRFSSRALLPNYPTVQLPRQLRRESGRCATTRSSRFGTWRRGPSAARSRLRSRDLSPGRCRSPTPNRRDLRCVRLRGRNARRHRRSLPRTRGPARTPQKGALLTPANTGLNSTSGSHSAIMPSALRSLKATIARAHASTFSVTSPTQALPACCACRPGRYFPHGVLEQLVDRIDAKLDRPADQSLLDADRNPGSESMLRAGSGEGASDAAQRVRRSRDRRRWRWQPRG